MGYNNFIASLERLLNAPFSYLIKDFLMQYRKDLNIHDERNLIMKPQQDEEGRHYVTINGEQNLRLHSSSKFKYNCNNVLIECLRKTSRGDVTIRSPGSGLITINGKNITYFDSIQSREQVERKFFSFVVVVNISWQFLT